MATAEAVGSGRKVARVKAELLRQIELNNFPRGSMLPPERELPERFGVSYMTVRKAISELVAEDYLERQPGVGTFVRRDISRTKLNGLLGIVCPAWPSPEVADFTIHASAVAELRGWCPKLFFCRFWEDRMIEDAWRSCDALWIIPPGPIRMMSEAQRERFASHEKPVVMIGVTSDVLGIDTVLGAPGQSIRMALTELERCGHRRVGLVSEHTHEGRIHPDRIDFDSWREWLTERLPGEEEKLFFGVAVEPYEMAHQAIYRRLIEAGRAGRFDATALVVSFSLIWGVMAALSDLGLKVPEDVSLIATGDRQEADFYRPRPTQVRKLLREHAEKAMVATDYRLRRRQAPVQCLLVEPELVPGETVRDLTLNQP